VAQASVEFDECTGIISVDAAADGARLSLEQEMLEPQDRPHPDIQNVIEGGLGEIADELWSTPQLTSLITSYFQQISSEGTLNPTLVAQNGDLDGSRPQMHLAPAIIVRRRTDRNLVRVFKEIAEQLNAGGEIPLGIERLVEIRDDRLNGEDREGQEAASRDVGSLYLPLPTNEAQKQIVERLGSRQGVLVQGPPGTGKSHTIVNLACHLLATGKRTLITSHTARALKVLKDYMNTHASQVAPLCVSLLGGDSQAVHELQESVQGILNRLHSWDSNRNRYEIQALERDLGETRRELAQAMAELRQMRSGETDLINLEFGSYEGTPQAIAERIAVEKPSLSWLQSFEPKDTLPPLDNDAAVELRALIQRFDSTAESQSRRKLPDQEWMLTPERFDDLVRREQSLGKQLDQTGAKSHPFFRQLVEGNSTARSKLKDALQEYVWGFDKAAVPDPWVQRALLDIASEKHALWQHLHDSTKKRYEEISPSVVRVSEFKVTGHEGHEISTLMADASVLRDHIGAGGRLGLSVQANPFASKPVKAALYISKGVRVNGRLCDGHETLTGFLDWIDVATKLGDVEAEWQSIEVGSAGKTFQQRFLEFKRRIEILERALGLRSLIETAREQGRLLGLPIISFTQVTEVRHLAEVVKAVDVKQELLGTKRDLAGYLEHLHKIRRLPDAHYLVSEAAAAIEDRDADRFAKVASEIEDARTVLRLLLRRDDLLSKLHPCNTLRDALCSSASDSVWGDRLARFTEAWNWCRANAWLQRFSDPGRERELLQQIDSCQQRIRTLMQELTACKAWEFVLGRMKPEEKEHLSAWKLAIKKIGKGTGKYAPQYRREAREHLEHCRPAIPAWVMPVYRVAETIQPKPGMFDVVIIDEASQSGPEALFLLYIAKKIVVVGDDQQISPEDVGIDREAVNSLRERFIRDLPHKDAMGVDNSFFEQAEIRFSGRIRLREHFRCMPEIIQFSNNLCYQSEPLVPLRQYGAGRLNPVIARHVSAGYVKGSGQRIVNEPEAEAIVQQIQQCLSDPAYEKKTMGIISLQGSAQAKLIHDQLMDRIGVQKMQERKIVCGDAYAFQGDERDIIFLSMVTAVSAANGDRHRIGALSKETDKRRFNVAASRAKDQMWLFHSITLEDLSQSCFRRSLLAYCLAPQVTMDKVGGIPIQELRSKTLESNRKSSRPPMPFDSWFEVDVFLRLVDRGFRVIPQYELAGKRIDLLVEGMRGRLAVECDGDDWHGPEQWEADIARQRMLERCGLEFWRLRGSTFYRDQEKALSSLWEVLERRGIRVSGEPNVTPDSTATVSRGSDESANDNNTEVGDDIGDETLLEESDEDLGLIEFSGLSSGTLFDEVPLEPYRTWAQELLPDPHTASLSEVMEGLLQIIEVEGPIVSRRAYALYNKAVGGSRLGRQTAKIMNRAVNKAVRLGRIRQSDKSAAGNCILQLPDRPLVLIRSRGPRRFEEIPCSEIAAVRNAIRTSHPSWDEEQVVRRLAEFFGIVRKTPQVRKILLG
jgi:very-short-patch-repair endonuclease